MTVEVEKEQSASDFYKPPANAIDVTPTLDGGVLKEIVKEGIGEEKPTSGCNVDVHYTGRLTTDVVFDSSRDKDVPFTFQLGKGRVIKAWELGIACMKKGEVARLHCRHDYAYGETGSLPKIPPRATLIFEVELIDWEIENLSGKKDGGILRKPITVGSGVVSPSELSEIEVHIVGEHEGRVFDDRELSYNLGEGEFYDIPPGVEKALESFVRGETSKLTLKSKYGFGAAGHEKFGIPPNSPLTYTVTLKDCTQARGSWMMSSHEKLDQAALLKEKGTKYFKSERFELALKMYKKGLEFIESDAGFQEELMSDRSALILTIHLNIAMSNLKLQNYVEAKKSCDTALELDSNNLKALFRRGQALLHMCEPSQAKLDFEKVVALEPTNKAAAAQINVCTLRQRELHSKEKKMYANMFEKFAQKDREWRFGWLEGEKPKVEIAPEDPEIEKEKIRQREAKRKFIEDRAKMLKERKERQAEEKHANGDEEEDKETVNAEDQSDNKGKEVIEVKSNTIKEKESDAEENKSETDDHIKHSN